MVGRVNAIKMVSLPRFLYLRQSIPNFECLPEERVIYKLLCSSPETKKLVSWFVNTFSKQVNCATHSLKNTWEAELGMQIVDELWERGVSRIHSCSVNVRHQLIQFKVLHRLHHSKIKLHRIFPTISPLCDHCKSAEGSLAHHFWTCPKLYIFCWHVWLCVWTWSRDFCLTLTKVTKESDLKTLEIRCYASV